MKDGKFEIGDEVICVNDREREHSLKNGEKYTIITVDGFNKDTVLIEDKHGISTNDPFLASRFKLVEPEFVPEYFSALNEKDAEKYIGKVMEFADVCNCKHDKKWEKRKFNGFTEIESLFVFEDDIEEEWDFMRTCPETFQKKKVKRTADVWANIYAQYRTIHDSKEKADEVALSKRIACVKLTGEYEVEE